MEIRLWRELLIPYELAVKDLVMKFKLLKKEHREKNLYSPIEQVTGRVKSINSILEKMQDKHVSWDKLEEKIEDIEAIILLCLTVQKLWQERRKFVQKFKFGLWQWISGQP